MFNPKEELPKTFEYVDLESVVGIEMLSHRTEAKVSAPSRAQRLAHTGDLFYQTVRPYQKNNYLFEKPDNNYVFSTGYAQMRPFVDGYFLLSLVQNESFVKVVLDSCTGTSYPAINANDLAEIEVFAPSDKNEAHKIGTIFRSLDNLITLHQYKCIPKQCSFSSRFTNPWEQRKLGEVAQSFEYGLNAAAKEYDGINKYLRITDIDDASRKFNTDNLTSPDTGLETAENYRLVDGDILFARTGASVGKSYIYRAVDGLVYFAGFLIRARIKPEYDAEFIFQNTLSESYGKYIQVASQRSGQPGVNAQEYADYKLYLPTYDEQHKIGAFLRSLDNLITLHQRNAKKRGIALEDEAIPLIFIHIHSCFLPF